MKRQNKLLGVLFSLLLACSLGLTACSSAQPFSQKNTDPDTITIGSQDYFSNEIIAEILAQSLENAGYRIDRDYRIGQREAYLPDVEHGGIDLFPEYSGNLLQYWNPDAHRANATETYQQLQKAAPAGITVLNQAEAADEDVYVVTEETAKAKGIRSLEDLHKFPGSPTIGGPYELKERDYGPNGIEKLYGAHVGFSPIEDSGGPLTIKALNDGVVDIARMSSSSPAIEDNHLVVLKDPRHLLPPSNVVPLCSKKLDEKARAVVNDVMSRFSQEDVVAVNRASVEQQKSAYTIAKQWLKGELNN